MCVAIDEHTVFQNGKLLILIHTYIVIILNRVRSFRETYITVGEIKSLIPPTVHLMALTATASKTTRNDVYRIVGLSNPILI